MNGDKANCDGTRPYGTSAQGEYRRRTTKVGDYAPNAWGLRDMYGNVREQCADWYGAYDESDRTDPTGPSEGERRATRGGYYGSDAGRCRSAARSGLAPTERRDWLGFRLVLGRVLPEESSQTSTRDVETSETTEQKTTGQNSPKTSSNAPTDWSGTRAAGTAKSLDIQGVEYKFRYCPAGTFAMGSPESEAGRGDDETQREVTLTQGFWMMETEVTQEMWKSETGTNPSAHSPNGEWANFVCGMDTSNFPVERVSWEDCQKFVEKLNASGCAPAEFVFRLPTEAEWEYACRAGTTPFSWGTSLNGDKANCDGTAPYGTSTQGERLWRTTKVGDYAPNAWGLRDMHGNVKEWCADWHGAYDELDRTDPTGPTSGESRVTRGGSSGSSAASCRSAARSYEDPTEVDDGVGFRLVLGRVLPEEPSPASSQDSEASETPVEILPTTLEDED